MAEDAYGRIARFYDPVVARTSRALADVIVRATDMAAGERVLDVACGTGVQLEVFASHGASCAGIDLSPAMLEVARRRLADHDVHLELADGTDLPFADGSFDVATTTMLLHELDRTTGEGVLREMRRVTASSGRLAIVDHASGSMTWGGRARRVVSALTERLAGRDHHARWRRFLSTGGLPTMLPPDLDLRTERRLGGGHLAVWVIGPDPDPPSR